MRLIVLTSLAQAAAAAALAFAADLPLVLVLVALLGVGNTLAQPAWRLVAGDRDERRPMQRLLMGEVGSGPAHHGFEAGGVSGVVEDLDGVAEPPLDVPAERLDAASASKQRRG